MGHIRGEVTIESAPHRVSNGVLRVRLIEVGRADAPAEVVSEIEILGVSVESGDEHFEFALEAPELETRSSYALEAHLDANRSGETTVGDYRTMEHIGVTSPEQVVSVPVRPVG